MRVGPVTAVVVTSITPTLATFAGLPPSTLATTTATAARWRPSTADTIAATASALWPRPEFTRPSTTTLPPWAGCLAPPA